MHKEELTINVRPPVSVYSTYRRLSYQPWYAIAEFVDNSTQNYYSHKNELLKAFRKDGSKKCVIDIEYDAQKNRLVIRDNCNGMDIAELHRAVQLNSPPADPSGRCEFGMGLKTAACWFGRKWKIETTRLGSGERYSVFMDVDELAHQGSELLIVGSKTANPNEHYTILTIDDVYKPMHSKTIGRIKEQLSSMYRLDLASGEIDIKWNNVPLTFTPPNVLEEDRPGGKKTIWKKDVKFGVSWESENVRLPVHGWIGIRDPGSQRDAGFVLLRRGRVILGGPDRGYKPDEVFGQGNTFRSQRLIGELHMDEWPVTQAKDMFDWSGGLEDKFIEALKVASKDYMEKAEIYRKKQLPTTKKDMQEAATEVRKIFENKDFLKAIRAELAVPTPLPSGKREAADLKKIKAESDGPITFTLQQPKGNLVFKIYWQGAISDASWMSVEYPSESEILVYLNSKHPFFEKYLGNSEMLELIQKFILALALAEKIARMTSSDGKIDPGDFRNYMNRVLRIASEIKGT